MESVGMTSPSDQAPLLKTAAARAGVVLLLAWLGLELHESGHLLVYWINGYRAWISFQRLHPIGDVPDSIQLWAKPAGPMINLLTGAVLLFIARRRQGFAWTTASFVNSAFRIFPCLIGIVRVLTGASNGFSDEGDIAFAITDKAAGRIGVILVVLIPAIWLTVLAAKEYRFTRRPILKSVAVYAVSFSVGLIAFRLDALFGLDK